MQVVWLKSGTSGLHPKGGKTLDQFNLASENVNGSTKKLTVPDYDKMFEFAVAFPFV